MSGESELSCEAKARKVSLTSVLMMWVPSFACRIPKRATPNTHARTRVPTVIYSVLQTEISRISHPSIGMLSFLASIRCGNGNLSGWILPRTSRYPPGQTPQSAADHNPSTGKSSLPASTCREPCHISTIARLVKHSAINLIRLEQASKILEERQLVH